VPGCVYFCSEISLNQNVKLIVFNWSKKWKLILWIPLSSYGNEHRIQILQIIAILHMISLEPSVISAYCTHWSEPESLSWHCRFMLTKVGRRRLAGMLTDFIGRYIHLQIILMLLSGICRWDIIWHRIPLMLTGEWSKIQEIRKENNC